ncbi:coiled-coil domain-containing protein [Thalassoglobus polymorphus]|uniref:Chromosome partition protein Smc n=1 Tax=Thalassoglobus polymorphus TaxID=2527994 RepID=A0A517QQ46_9PLAN|nr:hypothetical protein [Thalassoglobus polymorphus]QDT33758.1 Chromosome partition protein Smc [Thalassoglobus polymorphus]
MRRRSSTPSVTLFPFLAVLVCTMGALIFLLLVITQKIQKQSQLPVVSIEVPNQEPDKEVAPPDFPVVKSVEELEDLLGIVTPIVADEPEELDENEPILPLLAGNSLEENEVLQADWEAKQARLRAEYNAQLQIAMRKQKQIDQEWKSKVATLSSSVEQLEGRRKAMERDRSRLHGELKQIQSDQESLLQSLKQKQLEFGKLNSLTAEEKEQSQRLQNRAAELTRQIARLEEEIASLPPETEIVAYDSLTGTARKPILIECRKKEIVFVAEGVVLTAADLSGFPPEYNPVLAGAEALVEYWSRERNNNEKPYILLVVRPEGTTGFYIARGLLSKLDHRFGYELVDTNTDIRWSESEPGAIRACEEAVAAVLENRNRVAAKTGRLAATRGPLNYSNRAGEFHIPELDASNRSKKGSFLGDEKWLPPSRKDSAEIPRISPTHPQSGLQSENQARLQGRTQSRTQAQTQSQTQDQTRLQPPSQSQLDALQPSSRQPEMAGAPKNSNRETSSREPWTESRRSNAGPNAQRVFEINPSPRSALQQQPGQFSAQNARPMQQSEMPALLPINPFEGQTSDKKSGGGSTRGLRAPQKLGTIGIERELEIHLWSDQFQIDDQIPLKVPEGTAPAELKAALSSAVSKSTEDWGTAPQSYFWKPVVKIVIHPGGLLHYTKAKELTQDWDVPSNIEYELQ